MKKYPPALLFFLPVLFQAQNFQPVRTNTESFYVYASQTVTGIKPDSVSLSGTDTVLYHYRTMHVGNADTSGCWQMDFAYPSWQGIKTVIRQSGAHINFNLNNDSVFIEASAAQGQTSTMYTFSNGDKIKATVSSIQTETVNTFTDVVKTFSLQVTNSGGSAIAHNLNGKQVKLAQNGGWFKSLNWRDFPNDTVIYTIEPVKRLTLFDVYNFNVGDKIDKRSNACGGPPGENHYTIISKTGNATYTVRDTIYQMTYTGGNPPYQWQLIGVNTYTWTYFLSNAYIYDKMPEQVANYNASYPQAIPYPYEMRLYSNGPCGRHYSIQNTNADNYYYDTTAMCYMNTFEPVYNTTIYVEGEFDDNTNFSAQSGCYGSTWTVYYYNAATGTGCGTHNIYEVGELAAKLILYPNPATTEIVIEAMNIVVPSAQASIVDALGREFKVPLAIAGKGFTLDVSTLQTGIYNIRLLAGNKVYSGNFVKENPK